MASFGGQKKRWAKMKGVNFREARNNLKSERDQVGEDADCAIISRRDSEDAMAMSLETFQHSSY